MFSDNLTEFDLARECAQRVVSEYLACEHPDYPSISFTN